MTLANGNNTPSSNVKSAIFSLLAKFLKSSILCFSAGYVLYQHGKELGLSLFDGSWLTVAMMSVIIFGSIRTELVELLDALSVSIRSSGELFYALTSHLSNGLDRISQKIRKILNKLFL